VTLREARDRADLTREDLARRSGVSARQIYDIEHGRAIPRRATRTVLVVALGRVEIDWPTEAIKEAA
jgi:transcriptional regulator with XRE-family HTH domain